jgi:hypothetical protein
VAGFESDGGGHQDFPNGYFGDSDTFTGDILWVNTLWQRLSFLLDLKELYQLNESTDNRQTFQGQAQVTYQLGKLLLSLSYCISGMKGWHR